MSRYILMVFFSALICAPIPALAVDYNCPENLQTDQSIARLPHGWIASTLTADVPDTDHITVFDGPPGEMASLVPDNESKAGAAAPSWTFPADKERPVWMRCGYAGRTVYMMRALANEVTRCVQTAPHILSCD